MAEEVAAGYVSLYARMEGAQVANEISSVLESAASTAAGAFSGFGDIVSGIGKDLTIMSVGADALLTKAGKGVMNTIAMGESAAITFGTMGKAMGEAATFADDFMEKLNRFSVKTPFEFENTAAAVKQLLAMGFTANEILDDTNHGILVSAGNAASALGLTDQGLSNILLQFGHIRSMGKTMSYQMNALARNGLPAWKMLADYMGKSVEEVRAAVRAGEVDADTTIAALMRGMEQYSGQMERMSHTFMGIVSNFADAMKIPIQELRSGEGYKAFTDSLYNLTDPLEDLVRAFAPVLNSMFAQLAPIIDGVQQRVRQLTEWLNKQDPDVLARVFRNAAVALNSGPLLLLLGKGSSAIGNIFAGFGAAVSSEMKVASSGMRLAADGVAGFRESFTLLKEPLKNTRAGVLGFYNAIEMLATFRISSLFDSFRGIENVGDDVKVFGSQLMRLNAIVPTTRRSFSGGALDIRKFGSEISKFGSLVAGVAKASMPALTFAMNSFLRVFASVGQKLLSTSAIFGVVAVAASSLMAVLNTFGVNVADVVAKALVGFEQLVTSLPEKMAALNNVFDNFVNSGQLEALFVQLTQRLPVLLSDAFSSIFSGLQSPAIGEAFKSMVLIIADTIATNGPIILDGLLKAIGVAAQGLADAIPIVAAYIPEFVMGMANAIVENAPIILDGIKRAFQNIATGVGSAMAELTQGTMFEGVGKRFEEFGQQLSDLAEMLSNVDWTPLLELGGAITNLALAIGGAALEVVTGFVQGLADSDMSGVKAVADGLTSIANGFAAFANGGDADSGAKTLGTVLGNLANAGLENVGSMLDGIGKGLQSAVNGFKALSDWINGDGQQALQHLGDALIAAATGAEKLIETNPLVGTIVETYLRLNGLDLGMFNTQIEATGNAIKKMGENSETAGPQVEGVTDKLDPLAEKLSLTGEKGTEMGKTLSDSLKEVNFGNVTDKASNMADGIEGSFRRAINSTSGFSGQLSSNLSGASGSMGRIVSDAGVMAGGLESQFDKAGKSSNKLPPPVQAAMKSAINQVNLFVGCVRAAEGSVSSHVSSIAGAFDTLWGIDLYGAGQAIMSGFLSGLQSMWGAVQAFILMIGPWMKMFKGPLDYDRRLLVPAGKAIMSGLYKGLQSSFKGQVMPLVTSMAGTIDQAFEGVTSPLPSNVSVSMAGMANGDVRGPVIMQPVWNLYGVNDPEMFAHQSMRAMIQLANSEE